MCWGKRSQSRPRKPHVPGAVIWKHPPQEKEVWPVVSQWSYSCQVVFKLTTIQHLSLISRGPQRTRLVRSSRIITSFDGFVWLYYLHMNFSFQFYGKCFIFKMFSFCVKWPLDRVVRKKLKMVWSVTEFNVSECCSEE